MPTSVHLHPPKIHYGLRPEENRHFKMVFPSSCTRENNNVPGWLKIFSIFLIPLTIKSTILSHAMLTIIIKRDYNSSKTTQYFYSSKIIHKDPSMFEGKMFQRKFLQTRRNSAAILL